MSDETGNQGFSRRQVARATALGGMWPLMAAAAPGAPAQSAADNQTAAGTLLDVHQFGARGDAKTNDTKALQSAIDAAADRGGSVLIPPGVYLSGELQLRPHVGLIGVPAWDYRGGGGSVLRLIDEKAACLVNITAAFGCTIDGLSLEGRHLGHGVHGILLNKPTYMREDTFRVERSQITNFSGDGVRLQRAWCFTIRQCMIAYCAGDGISLRGWDGFLMDNWFSGNRGAGFAAREENASCTFTGNRIEWNREGILICGGDSYNITGNFFDRAGTCSLALLKRADAPCELVTVSGNIMRRSGKSAPTDSYDSAQIRLEGGRGISCCANTMQVGRDDDARGVYSPSYGIIYQGLEDCAISQNVLHKGAIRQLMLDLGGHGEGLVVKDNPGSLFKA